MNNGTLSGWVEAILLSILVLTLFTTIIVVMDDDYDKVNDIGIIDNTTRQQFERYMDTAQSNIVDGTVEYDSEEGITLKESYGLATGAIKIVWSFLTGGWIHNVINKLNLGTAGTNLAITLQILYFLSVVFALLFALFKIRM